MKVILYQGQKKFTVDNVSFPNITMLQGFINQSDKSELGSYDLQLYSFRITATRGVLSDGALIENEVIEREVEEGISWWQESVN
jgi:hypothetical protein